MGNFSDLVWNHIQGSIDVKQKVLQELSEDIEKAAMLMVDSLKRGGKILLCGNGGSAADSQHLAAEIVSRLKLERNAIPAIALTTDTSILTAIANDYSFDRVFVRQLEALGNSGDVLLGITTSGNSKNIIEAVKYAGNNEISTIVLSGNRGGKLGKNADISLIIPSADTQHIQESHIMIGHILCDIVEQSLFSE